MKSKHLTPAWGSRLVQTLALTVLPLLANGAVTFINFDDVPNNTTIDNHYPGVTFVNPLGGSIYARDGEGFAPSSPNVVSVFSTNDSIFPFFDARSGAVDAILATPVRSASIDVRPVGPVDSFFNLTSRPYIQAYDTSGNYLGVTVYYQGPLPSNCCFDVGPTETLTVVSPQNTNNIGRIRLTSQQPNPNPTYALFDNLTLDTGFYSLSANVAGGGSVSAAPLQSSYFYGAVVTLKAAANPGWVFAGWSGVPGGMNNPIQITMTADTTATAHFSPVVNSLIVDDPAATFSGTWTNVTLTSAYGGACRGRAADGNTTATATYVPNVVVPGNYDVAAWYPDTQGYGTSYARYAITYNGNQQVVTISQATGGGAWKTLATALRFAAGTNGYVQLWNSQAQSLRFIAADAIKLSWSAQQSMPPIVANGAFNGGCVYLSWTSVPNRIYRVQYKNLLSDPLWTDLSGDVSASAWTAGKTDCPPVGAADRFYRILLLPD